MRFRCHMQFLNMAVAFVRGCASAVVRSLRPLLDLQSLRETATFLWRRHLQSCMDTTSTVGDSELCAHHPVSKMPLIGAEIVPGRTVHDIRE